MTARAPDTIRRRLRDAIERLARGPSHSDRIHETDPAKAVVDARKQHRAWVESWITPELRQVLAWADGAETAHAIDAYGAGDRHGPNPEPNPTTVRPV